jgi:hypothetical protein
MTEAITRKKVQLDLSESSMDRLRRLKEKMEGSYADVIRNALKLLETVIKDHDDGSKFLVQDKDGNTRELLLFLNR